MSIYPPRAPQDRLHDLASRYCGVDMTQCWADLFLFDHLLDLHPVDAIIELGTAWGGLSLFLDQQAQVRGLRFATFDRIDHRTAGPDETFGAKVARGADLGERFKCVDVLADSEPVAAEIADHRVILFCDDGDKPAEVALYAPLLVPGSICVVHDWGTEIGPEDIPEYLVEIHGALCDELGSASRVFRRR